MGGKAGSGLGSISGFISPGMSFNKQNGFTNYKPPGGFGGGMGGGSVGAGPMNPGDGPMGGDYFRGGERPGTYGVPMGAPDGLSPPTNWKPPGGFGGGQMPPQTGGPLPPYQGGGSVSPGMGNSAVGTPSGPGGNWPFGGNPAGGERPGTYGVGGPFPPEMGGERPGAYGVNPGKGIRPRWRNGPLLGTPGVFGGR